MAVDIAAENAQTTGRTSWTLFREVGLVNAMSQVSGFARQVSVNVGETVQFSCDGIGTTIDIYRVGYYGGDGFRKIATVANTPATQPAPTVIPNSNGGTTCTGWSTTASWAVPSGATSGLYVAMLRGTTNSFYMMFVVRDDAATADIVYKTSDSTWGAAYNNYGTKTVIRGKNLYGDGAGVGDITTRTHAVSYHRPNIVRDGVMQTYWTACEMPLIRWLERNGFTIKYTTCVDLDRNGISALAGGEIFLSSGHDEYWSTPMRNAVEQWRDDEELAGKSIFMSGNEIFWRTRFEYTPSGEVIQWCYKDTMPGPGSHAAGQQLDPVTWTGTWKDTRWANNKPEWLLTGTDFRMNGVNDFPATIARNPYGGHKVWGSSALVDGDITLTRVIGFEADEVRPTQPTMSRKLLAAYTRNINGMHADDNGQTYTGNGDLTWGIISQRYASGGVTIGFGTCQWSWVLDGTHDRGDGTEVSVAAQQFTMNLLRSLGAEPDTPQSALDVTSVALPELDDYGLIPEPVDSAWLFLGDGTPLAVTLGDGTPLSAPIFS